MIDSFLWVSDPHLDLLWSRDSYLKYLESFGSKNLVISGDVSCGRHLERDLSYVARFPGTVMFVLGNHDYHFSSIKETHEIVKRACEKHENLLWLSSVGHVSVNSRVAIVGTEGWYDGMVGDPRWLRYTTDWALIDDFREMTPGDRLSTWRKMAMDSAINTTKRLESALCGHETVYVVTHVCPWVNGAGEESFGGVLRNLWRAYNVNCSLGHSIDYVGDKVPHKKIIVLSGHTHVNKRFFSRENVECRVGHGCSLFGLSRLIENKFFV